MLLRGAVGGLLCLALLSTLAAAEEEVAARQDVIVLLDPSLKAIAPTLAKSFDKFKFYGIRSNGDAGPNMPCKVTVLVGARKTVKEWRYLFEVQKLSARPADFGQGGVVVSCPYTLSFRDKSDGKPVVLAKGVISAFHRNFELAVSSFAEVAFSNSVGSDISNQLGPTLMDGKPTFTSNSPLSPVAWFPAVLVDGGKTLKIVLKNRSPVTLRVDLAIRSSILDTRTAFFPNTGNFLDLDPGEVRTLLLPVAEMEGIVPAWIRTDATPIDPHMTAHVREP